MMYAIADFTRLAGQFLVLVACITIGAMGAILLGIVLFVGGGLLVWLADFLDGGIEARENAFLKERFDAFLKERGFDEVDEFLRQAARTRKR
jgi:hypothetical protein